MRSVLLAFTFMNMTFAGGLPEIKVNDLTGQYKNGLGSAKAALWSLPGEAPLQGAEFSVRKEQDALVFSGDAGDFSLESLPDLVLDLQTFNWSRASVDTDANGIALSLANLVGSSSKQDLNLNSLSASCRGKNQSSDFFVSLLESCSKKASVKLGALEISEKTRSMSWTRKFLQAIMTNESASKTRLEKFELSINNSNFEARVKAKLDISATIKAEGKLSYKLSNGEVSEVRIRLDKARASFLNIKNKVFEAIEDNPMDGVRVQRPFIIIEIQ